MGEPGSATRPPAVAGASSPADPREPERSDRSLRDRVVLDVARRAVEQAARSGTPLLVDPAAFPPELRERRAAFVTLLRRGELRGCVGDLEAFRPLVVSVADSSFRAARSDPRFPPLVSDELPEIEIHASILTPLAPLPVASEEELLAALRPGVDGLVLREGGTRVTFLPAVWESLPEPGDFVAQLKHKAGWPPHYWSATLEVFRYETEAVGVPSGAGAELRSDP